MTSRAQELLCCQGTAPALPQSEFFPHQGAAAGGAQGQIQVQAPPASFWPSTDPPGASTHPHNPSGAQLLSTTQLLGGRRQPSPTPAPEPGAKGGPRLAAHSYPSNKTLNKPQIPWLKACCVCTKVRKLPQDVGYLCLTLQMGTGGHSALAAARGRAVAKGGSKRQAALPALPEHEQMEETGGSMAE